MICEPLFSLQNRTPLFNRLSILICVCNSDPGWTADDADEARVIEDGRGAQEIFLDVMMRGFSPDEIDCMRGCTERNLKDDNV